MNIFVFCFKYKRRQCILWRGIAVTGPERKLSLVFLIYLQAAELTLPTIMALKINIVYW